MTGNNQPAPVLFDIAGRREEKRIKYTGDLTHKSVSLWTGMSCTKERLYEFIIRKSLSGKES